VALIIGEDELASNSVMVKPLRGQAEQQQVSRDQVASELVALLADN
jgi:histidyl-tRNA synthetase